MLKSIGIGLLICSLRGCRIQRLRPRLWPRHMANAYQPDLCRPQPMAWNATIGGEMIFVFGSNLAGRHGKGAALYAKQYHGAVYGVGVGRTGNAYAIPTKDANIKTLPLEAIRPHVAEFLKYARDNPKLTFQVTAIGCGLAGYKPNQIASMFIGAPANCQLPPEFVELIQHWSNLT